VFGSFLALISIGLLVAGGVVLVADATLRDDDDYLTSSLQRVDAPGHAVATENIELRGSGAVVPERWLGDIKVEATATPSGEVFIGLARTADVDAYLDGVAHSVVSDNGDTSGDDDEVQLDDVDGGPLTTPPTEQDFWEASATGPGTQTLTWEVDQGDWTVVVMDADGSAPVAADVEVGATVPVLDEIGIALLVAGGVLGAGAVILLVVALRPGRPS
jgi:hypothetical protein